MTSSVLLAQMGHNEQLGWLSRKLLGVTLTSAEWVLWLLVVLSVLSIALMLERAVYFATHRLPNSEELAVRLARGELDAVRAAVGQPQGHGGRRAARGAGLGRAGRRTRWSRSSPPRWPASGPSTSATCPSSARWATTPPSSACSARCSASSRPSTTWAQLNAKGAAIQQTVMAGISEALVATAVGLAVAIPAVVAFNVFNRQLKTLTARTNALGHALVGSLRASVARAPRAPGRRGGALGHGRRRCRTTTRRSRASTSRRWWTSCWCCSSSSW